MTYAEKLQSEDWNKKRNEILKRDKHECQKCHNKRLLDDNILIGKVAYSKDINNGVKYQLICLSSKSDFFTILRKKKDISGIVYFTPKDEKGLSKLIATRENDIYDLADAYPGVYVDQNGNNISSSNAINRKFKWLKVANLHIHHKYYNLNWEPWEYPDDALVTLCWICHEEEHKDQKIEQRDNNMNVVGYLTPCHRCFGAGIFPEYSHIQNGICFRCNGARFEEMMNT